MHRWVGVWDENSCTASMQENVIINPISKLFDAPFNAGNSVCLFVHGFEPYFYLEAPVPTFSPDDCRALADMFNVRGRWDGGKESLNGYELVAKTNRSPIYSPPAEHSWVQR